MDQLLAFIQLASSLLRGVTFIDAAQLVFVVFAWWLIIGAGIIGPLFVGYVFVTHLDKVKKANGNKLPPFVWIISLAPAIVTVILDVVFHLGWGWALFMDFIPHEWTLSQRMTRLWDTDTGTRREIVGWIKRNTLIDSFDFRGMHIGNKP
jgi:hypothetical protein